jgi:two-component system OmpR family sensor kinase
VNGTPAAPSPAPGRRSGLARLRALPEHTPLRLKLVAGAMVLLCIALLVTGGFGWYSLRGYLTERVDAQLMETARRPPRLDGQPPRQPSDADTARPAPTNGFYTVTVDPAGTLGSPISRTPEGSGQSAPQLPALDAASQRARANDPFTVAPTGAGYDWRVLVVPRPDGSGSTVVAVSLDDVDNTLGRLVRIQLWVGLAVLLALAVLGYAAVRSTLRRLVEVEETAEAIAAGDLTRRVRPAPARTEVGRLARALNTMLGQIETAFRDRQASERQARASEERMRRFIADASHELRTPITSIRGFAELYRSGAVTQARTEHVMQRVEAEATRMGLLVEDLLLLARLDQERQADREPVDLLAIAQDAVGDARLTARDHRLSLEEPPGGEAAVVLGDEPRLRQVVANLMSNALTHTPPGTAVTVRVRVAGDDVCCEVADSGPGMTAEEADRIFERFYRTEPSRARSNGGAGLGLSIVASLVAAQGGRVSVRAAPGEGACFRVVLPRFVPPAVRPPAVGPPGAAAAVRPGS